MSFQAHLELLDLFLGSRGQIVEAIQGLLNAQRKPVEYLRDAGRLAREFEDHFFTVSGVSRDRSRLRGQLDDALRLAGFAPRTIPGLYNGLIEPAEMLMRAFHLWRETRWPGRSGRLRYAHTLFNLYILRCLALLSLRVWDEGRGQVRERLSQVQDVLDRLWNGSPDDQPILVRDARWLILLAQSPATDDLGAYFGVAQNIVETLPEEDRLVIHKAAVRMAGGHLRSQLRYHSTKQGVSLDEYRLILSTRTSNALDFALLIQDLVPLLEAYEHACGSGDSEGRLHLADAICQGLSADPELFLNRIELLGAYSMIEHVFTTTDGDGQARPTAAGRRHLLLLEEYAARITRVAGALGDDCPRFRPMAGTCSPYGVLYGFSTNLIEHMAFRTLQPDAVTPFSLEDVFTTGDTGKLAWVNGWRKLPHLTPDVAARFAYPQQFAEDTFQRLEQALRAAVADGDTRVAVPTGRLFIVPAGTPHGDSHIAGIPDLPARYVHSSDTALVVAQRAEASDERQILADRREAKFVVSYQTAGGWVGISKAFLSDLLGAGRDVKIVGLPPAAAGVLQMMCPGLTTAVRGVGA